MVPAPDWQATDEIARSQLDLFHDLGDRINLTPDDRRRALNLTDRDWRAWQAFRSHGPIPAQPPLPEMLRRIAHVAFNLTLVEAGRTGSCDQARPAESLAGRHGPPVKNGKTVRGI